MFTEQEEKAFIIIDNFLNELTTSKRDCFFSTYAKPTEYFLAKEIMDKHRLITYRAPGSKMSIIDIGKNGLTIIKAGGIKKYLLSLTQKSEEKERLEYEKINAEIIDIRNRIFDYDSTKKRAIRGEWIAALGLLLSAIAILITLLSKKSG